MKCIAIPNKYTEDNDFSMADKVVGSVADISRALLENL